MKERYIFSHRMIIVVQAAGKVLASRYINVHWYWEGNCEM